MSPENAEKINTTLYMGSRPTEGIPGITWKETIDEQTPKKESI